MMAFFLLMWLLNATTEEQRKGLADYFSPNSVLSHNSSGIGQPFGGRTAFSEGAMLSDLGSPQVTVGNQPVVDQVEEDGSDVIAQPRPHRDDAKNTDPDLGGRSSPEAAAATGAERRSRRADIRCRDRGGISCRDRGGAGRCPAQADRGRVAAELDRREKQAFDQAAQQIRDAVSKRSAIGRAGTPACDRHDAGRAAHSDPRC